MEKVIDADHLTARDGLVEHVLAQRNIQDSHPERREDRRPVRTDRDSLFQQVADVTGAGDTVIGTLAMAIAAGATPLEASLLANYAGGIVVMKVGTAVVSRAELAEAVSTDSRPLEELEWARS